MLAAGRAVELARRHEDPAARRARPRSASSPRPGSPRGRATPRSGRCGSRRASSASCSSSAPGGVRRALHVDVGVVVEGGDHRALLRAGHLEAEVLADREQLADQRRVAGHERAAVAGEVGPLGEGVDGEDALGRAAVDLRVRGSTAAARRGRRTRRTRCSTRRRRASCRARGTSRPPCGGGPSGSTRPVGLDGLLSHSSARRARDRTPSASRSRPARGTGQRRADLVGRVGQRRVADQVTRTDAEVDRHRRRSAPWSRSPAARRRGRGRSRRGGGPASRSPPGASPRARSSSGSPASRTPPAARPGRRRAWGRRGCRPRGRRCRRGGRAPSRRTSSACPRGSPGAGGRPAGADDHSSCSCGGSAATSSWSLSMTPILAAPPGEPRSSKKWTLAS